MITLEEWVMIKHLHKQGVPKARIARELGLDPRTVDRAINSEEHPERKRQPRSSILDSYKDYVRQRLDKYDLTGTRILREIQERGYPGSYTMVKEFVREVKGAKPKPAFVRYETEPGEQAQSLPSRKWGWTGQTSAGWNHTASE